MQYVLAVDGGNTKTIALVARLDGSVIGAGRGRCGDIYGAESPEAALAELDVAVTAALGMAGLTPADLELGLFSMAGADWPEDFVLLADAARIRGYGRTVQVVNDAIGALRAGASDGIGVVVACGTGAAVGARGPDGRIWHSSFWQEPGGGDHLGKKAVRAVLRAELGIDPPTMLSARVLALSGAPSVEELLRRATGRNIPKAIVPDARVFGRVMLDTAADGDPVAQRIVIEHGSALGDYALVAARRVGLIDQAFDLVLTGGVLRHPSPLLVEALIARVQVQAPGARPIRSDMEPAAGALLLALEAAGVVADAALLARLRASLPPPAFFET